MHFSFLSRKVKINGEEKQVLMEQLGGRKEPFVSLRAPTFQQELQKASQKAASLAFAAGAALGVVSPSPRG